MKKSIDPYAPPDPRDEYCAGCRERHGGQRCPETEKPKRKPKR